MDTLFINGGRRLSGKIVIQGSKNSILPIMASVPLIKGTIVINNCPDIVDVEQMIGILADMGCECSLDDNRLTILNSGYIVNPDMDKCMKLRASVILMSSLLASVGEFVLPYPGGCNIGKRPVNYHIDGLTSLGAAIEDYDGILHGKCGSLKGCEYTFMYPSVGALENMIIGSVLASGVTKLHGCAKEPEIQDLCDFLRLSGAIISGDGTDNITIIGVKELCPCEFNNPGDRIVAGTYMLACTIANGNIKLEGIKPDRVSNVTDILRKTGAHIFTDESKNEIIVMSDGKKNCISYIEAGPYPEFPTDMQPFMMVYMSYARGYGQINDTVFTNRYGTAFELSKMNADISMNTDGALIRGYGGLKGAKVTARDLRGGAALVIAALGADGASIITDCSHICRGYEDIQRDLEQLGADIIWQEIEEISEK